MKLAKHEINIKLFRNFTNFNQKFDYESGARVHMDPRIFLVLPEHVSNAHHIWNYALFISQMSNLNNLDSFASILKSHKNQENNANQVSLNDSRSESEANLFECLINDLHLNDLKRDYLKLNKEAIMTVLKIKKRNKASLFNLILPPALSLNATSCHEPPSQHSNLNANNNDISKLNSFKSTTPWLLKETRLNLNNETDLTENENGNKQDSESSFSSSSSSVDGQNQVEKSLENEYLNSNDENLVDSPIEFDYNEGCKR